MSNSSTQQFEQTIGKYKKSLVRIVASYEANPALQEELHQEILLAIWQGLPRFQGASAEHTFVYRIAYNQAMNHVAKHSRIPGHEEIEGIESKGLGPEQSLLKDERIVKLILAIRKLPVLQRQLMTLTLEGISYRDIAEISGLSQSNVGVQINRAKAKLKKMFEVNHVKK